MDWCGPIPESDSDELVEFPDTRCPFLQDQVNVLPKTDNMNYLDGIETFRQIVNLI